MAETPETIAEATEPDTTTSDTAAPEAGDLKATKPEEGASAEPASQAAETDSTIPQASPQKATKRSLASRDGSYVSRFTEGFPDDRELGALVCAFEQGRYDVVRKEAPKLAQSTSNPEVANAANVLRSRLDADPLAVRLLAFTFILLAVLTAWLYLVHPH